MRTLLAAFVVIAVVPTLAQQPTAPAMLTLRGVVVTANDVPLPRVRVAFVPPDVLPAIVAALPELERAVLTDARGQFAIAVPSGPAVRLSFTKARYAAQTADLPQRDLTAQRSGIRVRLSLAGAISGQVLDRSGARVMSASVTLQRVGAASTAVAMSTDTNDLGEFRFGGLAEGTFAITVKPSTFALNGPIADRQAAVNAVAVQGPTVSIGRGDEVGNITLTIDPPSELVQRIAGVPEADPEATASLSGRITGPDGLPIVRAVVRAMRQGTAVRNVETDTRGRYVIDRLATGDYIVEAQKYGYINRQYGQERVASIGRRVSLQKGQVVASIDVTLERGGAIAGTIVDELGEPVQGAAISALQLAVVAGRTRALRASTIGAYKTDDRGQYRLFGLQPGTYVVQATIGDTLSATTGYLPQFYPGTSSIDQATPTKVDLNAAASGIDLTLIPTAAHRVTGIVLDSSGKPARASLLLAVSERSGAIQTEPVRSRANADGSFVFTNVGPGDYVVQTEGSEGSVLSTRSGAAVPTSGRLFASSFVTVTAADPPPMSLQLSAGATLVGRVRYEGVPAGPPPNLTLTALPTDFDRGPLVGAGPMGFSIQPDGSFEYRGVFGPTLLVARPQQADWYLKSIMFKGQDLTDSPFDFGTGTSSDIEVLISAFGAAATGSVTDERLAPIRDYSVILFSTFRDKWFAGSRRVKTARPDQDGAFSVVGLPPGDYWIVAIDRLDSPVSGATVPPDPALLESLSSRAIRVTLSEGQSQDLTLRLTRR